MKPSPVLLAVLAAALALAPLASPSLAAKRDRAERSATRDASGSPDGAATPDAAPSRPRPRGGPSSPPSTMPGADEEAERPAAPRAQVKVLGEGTTRLHLVDHGDGLWSMHAESLGTYVLFGLWKEAGGPEVIAKDPVDNPYTLSLHRVKAEEIVSRLLAGHGYTLHYEKGRLAQVRVYSAEAGHVYRTPRLTESLGAWRDVETGADPDAGAR